MPLIILETKIKAPIESVFDLSRSIDQHVRSMDHTNERAVAGKTSGLIEQGQEVTWEARHFGIKQNLTVRITEMDKPNSFTDVMIKGAFKSMKHVHLFEENNGVTQMTDHFHFESPFGAIGRLFNAIILTSYMRRLLESRNQVIKESAEKAT